jgi:glycosyltransferase involved in cell wall biosynthesis
MRVCFFAERQVGIGSIASVLERQVRLQHDVDVTWRDVTYYEEGGAIERLPLLPAAAKSALRAFRQTGEGLRAGPFDALFFLTHNPAVLRHGALKRTPTCVWTDVTPMQLDRLAWAYEHPVATSPLVRSLKQAAVARTFRLAERCLGWSSWTTRSFIDDYGVGPEKTAVVAPGIEVSHWAAPPREAREGRPFKFVFVGGHFERKGGKLLLDVYRQRLRDRCELSIITRDEVPEERGVRVHRNLVAGSDALRTLLHEADAFVLPTLADCHSIASLEAMASGLPVVLTRIGASSEIVQDGRSGILIPPADGAALGDALERLAADRAGALAMGARGLELAKRDFDAHVVAGKIFEHLRAMAGRGKAATG